MVDLNRAKGGGHSLLTVSSPLFGFMYKGETFNLFGIPGTLSQLCFDSVLLLYVSHLDLILPARPNCSAACVSGQRGHSVRPRRGHRPLRL